MACKDCENSNPITPVYSKAKYLQNGNCADQGCPNGSNIYVPPDGGGVSEHELIAGNEIAIEDLSDVTALRHRISYDPYINLSVNLSVKGYESDIYKAPPILKGTVINKVVSEWSYNKGVVVSQTLNEDGGGAVPVPIADRLKSTVGISITDNITNVVSGDDGEGQSGSIASDSATLQFGNYFIVGDYPKMDGQPVTNIATLIANLANKIQTVKTSRGATVYGTGGVNQRFFVIYPESWGFATFQKGIFPGGFERLKNDGGTLTVVDPAVESPITVTNDKGYIENYYVYQSVSDDINDPAEPIIVS